MLPLVRPDLCVLSLPLVRPELIVVRLVWSCLSLLRFDVASDCDATSVVSLCGTIDGEA